MISLKNHQKKCNKIKRGNKCLFIENYVIQIFLILVNGTLISVLTPSLHVSSFTFVAAADNDCGLLWSIHDGGGGAGKHMKIY